MLVGGCAHACVQQRLAERRRDVDAAAVMLIYVPTLFASFYASYRDVFRRDPARTPAADATLSAEGSR